MDRDFEKRFFTSVLLMVVFFGFYLYLFNQMGKKSVSSPSSGEISTNTHVVTQAAPLKITAFSKAFSTNISLKTPLVRLDLSGEGGGVSHLSVDGSWNQSESPVSLLSPVGVGYGSLQWEKDSTNILVFSLVSATETKAEWKGLLVWNTTPLDVRVSYELLSHYTFVQHVIISNTGKEAAKIDYQGRSFLLRWRPDIMSTNEAGTGNMQTYGALVGKKFLSLLKKGLFSSPQKVTFLSNFQWVSVADNYFVFIAEPKSSGISASYEVENRYKTVEKTALTLYLPVLLLGAGETTNFTIQYYCGPRKESLLRQVNPTYGQLFRWPTLFAWFMKPIEWAMVWLLNVLGGW
ncbi:MAG: membrane protein insertase YidC, partial [Brevinematales bacterium]